MEEKHVDVNKELKKLDSWWYKLFFKPYWWRWQTRLYWSETKLQKDIGAGNDFGGSMLKQLYPFILVFAFGFACMVIYDFFFPTISFFSLT